MTTTRLSSKGQVIIPKAVRQSKRWAAGTELTVEERPEGVLLRPASSKRKYSIDDLYGVLKYDGPPKSLADMERGIDEAMQERWARKSQK
ncbi:MAG: AbrB/MazE/SpoVT family DNA-binding domain-containing protein [Beijerinckiaceae bacterium]